MKIEKSAREAEERRRRGGGGAQREKGRVGRRCRGTGERFFEGYWMEVAIILGICQ